MKLLRQWSKATLIERGFLASLVLLCAILTALQYHWTGEISRTTTESLLAGFGDQVDLVGKSFDAELTNACNQLLPYDNEIDPANRAAVHVEHFRRWAAAKHRPLFRRLGVAVVENRKLQLYTLDQKSPQLAPADWPPEWSTLRDNFEGKVSGDDSPPFQDAAGTLLEFPIFGHRGETEWMIVELDLAYVRQTWLPELVGTYLNREGRTVCDVTVQTIAAPTRVLYSTGSGGPTRNGKTVKLRFNRRGRTFDGGGPRGGESSWLLTARQHSDILAAAVDAARWRNLALACMLTGLTLAAGLTLVRYTRRSRKLAESQMQFVANVSHELRTPLTVIRGAGHNLLRGIAREPAQIAQYSQLIIQHADQLAGMVEQVLELAGARSKEGSSTHRPVALAEVLREAIAATASDTAAGGCRVQAEIGPDLPVVKGDAQALRRVFQNLITNAAKHGGGGRWIGVFTESINGDTPPMVEVRVADQGAGIPENEQARIFESFFRGSAARQRQIRGSGLGLSLVREIVEAHRGSVTVRSDGKCGTVFTVRLPVAGPEPTQPKASQNMKP